MSRVGIFVLGCLGFSGVLVSWSASAEPTQQDSSFVSRLDGSEQRYVLMLPEGFVEKERHDVLIALHGHGSDRWQFVRDLRDECRAARDAAARHRMIYVSPDYRAKTSWMGPAAEADLLQIIAMVKKRYKAGRVYLCGGSMGGTSALIFAALHPKLVAGVAAMNPTANMVEFAGFQDAIAESYGGSKTEKPEQYRKRSAELFPKRFRMPVGITVGDKDEVVPPQSATRLAAKLAGLKRSVLLIHREDGGHSTDYADATRILEFAISGGR